jgi:acyl-CoA thioesterase-2
MRTFGGQVAAQALVAAGRTVSPDRPVHSLHSHFLRPGNPTAPLVYLVDRLRDGGSFTTRRVNAVQYGETIFSLSASFKVPEDSPSHQLPMPVVRTPEDSVDLYKERADERDGAGSVARFVLELRGPDPTSRLIDSQLDDGASDDESIAADGDVPRRRFWMRSADKLPDDPLLHVCALAYMSDLTLAGTATLRHVNPPAELRVASLDHAMWFHRPFRADEWLLFSVESPSSSDARGLALGEYFTENGALIASVMQEALIRRPR